MELVKVAVQIEYRINLLERGRKEIQKRAEKKAEAIAEYDKQLAITLIKIRNAVEMELDGNKFKSPAVSVTEKIAKGMVWQECLNVELATAEYKNAVAGMAAIEAELNGFQSIFRHLSEV